MAGIALSGGKAFARAGGVWLAVAGNADTQNHRVFAASTK